MLTAERIIEILQLRPHPEGGFFSETFRAEPLPFALPERGLRSASTAIYFLLRAQDFSALHVVSSDEVWHHYLGDALELDCFDQGHRHRRVVLGADLLAGQRRSTSWSGGSCKRRG
jgi:predicted cupin superfamily sugar epimerase